MNETDEETLTGDTNLEALRVEACAPVTEVSEWGASTSQGLLRPENEDAFGHLGTKLFVIADGMGGHAGGRMAATGAVQCVLSTIGSIGLTSMTELVRTVSSQVRLATRARGHERAGTTLLIVRVLHGVATIANVGDSRVYRLRERELSALTTDHTVHADLVARGLDPAAHRSVGLHALTRYVGAADGNDVPDVTSLVPKDGDRLLLATDGIFKQLSDTEIVDAALGRTPNQAAGELVNRADQAGGRDNATVIVLDFAAANDGERS